MNALLSVLQPSPEARTIHRRLGHVLECQRFELLQAKANIWEPGEDADGRTAWILAHRVHETREQAFCALRRASALRYWAGRLRQQIGVQA
jgi:hypothetical protein